MDIGNTEHDIKTHIGTIQRVEEYNYLGIPTTLGWKRYHRYSKQAWKRKSNK